MLDSPRRVQHPESGAQGVRVELVPARDHLLLVAHGIGNRELT